MVGGEISYDGNFQDVIFNYDCLVTFRSAYFPPRERIQPETMEIFIRALLR